MRYRKKKPFYEVAGKGWPKSGQDRTLGKAGSEESGKSAPSQPGPTGFGRWPRKPRLVQLNGGRVEISVPYQLAIAVVLGIVLLALVCYRLGQFSNSANQKAPQVKPAQPKAAGSGTVKMSATVQKTAPEAVAKSEPVKSKGDNRIVIQTYQRRADLEPVKNYFAGFGIETEIIRIDNWYYLVTKEKYENPEKPGTDGYAIKQKIIALGANYRAPAGYESFGKKPFHDLYGMKFED